MRPTTILLTLFLIGGIAGDLFSYKVAAANTYIDSGRGVIRNSTPQRTTSRITLTASKQIPRIRPASRGEKPALRVGITAYTWTGHRTASGEWPRAGRTVAADTKIFPMGTVLRIDGYGVGVVEDTGRKIKGKRLDVYFNTRKEAIKWGFKMVEVEVIGWGPKITNKK